MKIGMQLPMDILQSQEITYRLDVGQMGDNRKRE